MSAQLSSAPQTPSGSGADWMEQIVRPFFRYSLAVIFIWFGALKIFNVSPAYELITRTFSFFPPHFVNLFLGWWELITGALFLFKPLRRAALILMALQIPGTFLPLLIVPEMCFVKAPWILTTNGEFIIKNLLLIGAGLLLGAGLKSPEQFSPNAKILT